MATNRQAGLEFKRRVMLYLLQRGIPVADPMDNGTRLYQLVGPNASFSDIVGLEPWVVDVRTSMSGDISTALTDASNAARASASEWPVVIMSRRGKDIEEAYAVVPLHVMVRIFAGESPKLARSAAGIAK